MAHRPLLPLLAAMLLLPGCTFDQRLCADNEYPAKAIGSTTGRTCAQTGDDPPQGYVRYPPGQVPEHGP